MAPATQWLKKHIHTLEHLAKCSPNTCKHLIDSGSDDLVLTLSELCQNLLVGNIPFSPPQMVKLKKAAATLRLVAKRTTSTKQKRAALVQTGGFFIPALIGMALPLIKSIL